MSRKQHDEYLEKLCALCLKKTDVRQLTGQNIELIIRHICPEFNRDQDWLPKGLCSKLVLFYLPDFLWIYNIHIDK